MIRHAARANYNEYILHTKCLSFLNRSTQRSNYVYNIIALNDINKLYLIDYKSLT